MVTRGKVQVMTDIKSVATESKNLKKGLAVYNLAIKNAKTTETQKAAKTALANEMKRIKPIQKEITGRWNALSSEYNKAFNNEPKTYAQAEDVAPGTQAARMAAMANYGSRKGTIINRSLDTNLTKPKTHTIPYSTKQNPTTNYPPIKDDVGVAPIGPRDYTPPKRGTVSTLVVHLNINPKHKQK